jgi:hypothetical protein
LNLLGEVPSRHARQLAGGTRLVRVLDLDHLATHGVVDRLHTLGGIRADDHFLLRPGLLGDHRFLGVLGRLDCVVLKGTVGVRQVPIHGTLRHVDALVA